VTNVLHFPGDCTNYDPRLIYGPDLYGAHYKCVGAEFDPVLNRTTLQMKPVPPADLAKLAEEIFKRGTPLWEGYRRE
jgi:hypothetical protein